MIENIIEIIRIVIWPITIIISVIILRKGILELIPNLKKLKYKDLEVEFEKEAIKIRATIERDIPYIEPPEEKPVNLQVDEPRVQYSVRKLSPPEFVLHEWSKVENKIISLMKRSNLEYHSFDSVRSMINKLKQEKIIDSGTEDALLELSAYRNKVAHAHEDLINDTMSSAYYESAKRINFYLDSL